MCGKIGRRKMKISIFFGGRGGSPAVKWSIAARCCYMPATMPTRTMQNNDKAAPFEGYHNTSGVLLERKHEDPSHGILLDRNMLPSRSRPTIKQTRFSESSMLFLYPQNSYDVKITISYTASDGKLFPKTL